MRTCRLCSHEFPLDEDNFYRNTNGHLVTICKPCYRTRSLKYHKAQREADPQLIRKRALKRRYNLTLEQFEAMSAAQNGCCQVCGRKPKQDLYIDHHHVTGKVRGLLCPRCNGAMHALDEPGLLEKLLEYRDGH